MPENDPFEGEVQNALRQFEGKTAQEIYEHGKKYGLTPPSREAYNRIKAREEAAREQDRLQRAIQEKVAQEKAKFASTGGSAALLDRLQKDKPSSEDTAPVQTVGQSESSPKPDQQQQSAGGKSEDKIRQLFSRQAK